MRGAKIEFVIMKPESEDPDIPLPERKTGDRALIMLLVGCLMLTPPLAGIFQIDIRVLGIPFTGLYLFIVWGALIAGAAVLSGRLQSDIDAQLLDDELANEEVDKTE